MREILFRGIWVHGNNEWIVGDLVRDSEGKPHIVDTKYAVYWGGESTFVCEDECEVIPETVGQYTGLTDKNGKKIFEGDILVESKKRGGFDEWCYRYEVVYTSDDVGSCGCCVPEFSGIGFVFQGITGRFRGVFDELEIIGNVHDNPEMLEVK